MVMRKSHTVDQIGLSNDARVEWVCPHCAEGRCWPSRKTCYKDSPSLVGVGASVGTVTERHIAQQVEAFERSLRESVSEGIPSFSSLPQPSQPQPTGGKKQKKQRAKVEVL